MPSMRIQNSGKEEKQTMNLNELVIALREKRKWEDASAELSKKLREVEKEIAKVSAKLQDLELELGKMMEMLHAAPSGNAERSLIKIKEEVK